ncbi:IS3 family transposase [Saccharopolyspora spinosa]|uniref:IS3 family transposase n=1 Tax=Saccharopolyspora spinosa TaxID=60894 RepID=UPI000237B63F
MLLDVAGLARSTFFYHQARQSRPDPQEELKAAIQAVFEENKRRYGHRGIHRELVGAGWRVAKKTAGRFIHHVPEDVPDAPGHAVSPVSVQDDTAPERRGSTRRSSCCGSSKPGTSRTTRRRGRAGSSRRSRPSTTTR